jgi:hypothetical protein
MVGTPVDGPASCATGARSDGETEIEMAEMTPVEDNINQRASFLPMTGPYRDEDGDGSLPCLMVGGIQVYAYFKGGELVVSVHYDTADARITTDEGTVPTRVSLGGEDVHYEP